MSEAVIIPPVNTRNFTVKGKINCTFKPECNEESSSSEIEFLVVEIWCKTPLNVIFLGRGITNEEGEFSIVFEINGAPSYLVNGKIENTFLKVYYKGILISGANPYVNDECCEPNDYVESCYVDNYFE